MFGTTNKPLAQAWWRIAESPPTAENILRLCGDDEDVAYYLDRRPQGSVTVEEASAILILWRVSTETSTNLLEDVHSVEELWSLALDAMINPFYWRGLHGQVQRAEEVSEMWREQAGEYEMALIRLGHYENTPTGLKVKLP